MKLLSSSVLSSFVFTQEESDQWDFLVSTCVTNRIAARNKVRTGHTMAGTHIHIHIHAKESTRQIPKETNERTGIWILLLQSTTFSALMLRLFFVLLSPPLIHLPLYPSVHSSLFFSLALSSSFFLSLQLCYCLCVHRTQVESSHIRSLLLDAYTLAFSEV